MNWYRKAKRVIAYGGPRFDLNSFADEFVSGDFQSYTQLYEEAQLAVDYVEEFGGPAAKELIWFLDSLNPQVYASGLTVESAWIEDYNDGIRYMEDLIRWSLSRGEEEIDAEELAQIDPSSPQCIHQLMWDYDWETIGDNYDFDWGPHEWQPEESGEWDRCRNIAQDWQEYPVIVLFTGEMVDGAHRLAVANKKRQPYYPCLVGVPRYMMEDLVRND